jgi:rhamnose utilization protein RhaD (predicted bifunctional aldolase and dehydrogenase)
MPANQRSYTATRVSRAVSKIRAMAKPETPVAACRQRITGTIEPVGDIELNDAVAPWVSVWRVSKLVAGGTVHPDHVIDLALLLRGKFRL